MFLWTRFLVFSLILVALIFVALPVCAQTVSRRLELVGRDELPTVVINDEKVKIHTQGLFVTNEHYLVTGRLEQTPKKSLLIRFLRGTKEYETLDITQTVKGTRLDHPGGFDQATDGTFWIPISTSHRRGPTRICGFRIDSKKPLVKSRVLQQFEVEDHIGALCCVKDALVTANWDTNEIASYRPDGTRLYRRKQDAMLLRGKPHIAVQDWKRYIPKGKKAGDPIAGDVIIAGDQPIAGDVIIAGGLDKSSKSQPATVLLANFAEGSPVEMHRLEQPKDVARPVTNEGLHYHDGTLYLLPEDIGRGAKVLRYKWSKSPAKPARDATIPSSDRAPK